MASPTPSSAPKVRFGAFELDPSSGTIRKGGIPVKLQPQPFRVLLLLAGRPGRVVSRDEIQRYLWGESTFVDFERGINFSINQIRSALCDSAEKPRYVETLPRVGYRFIASVTVDSPSEAVEIPRYQLGQLYDWPRDQQATLQPTPQQERANSEIETFPQRLQPWKFALRLRNLFVLIGGGLLVLAVFLVLLWRYKTVPGVSHDIRSLAVLPLENVSGDLSQDYFADGMTDELITSVGQISSLRVISRTSVMRYKGVRKPLPQIARELNVDAIVEGTVVRSGDQVRITAQLIQTAADKHLWAQDYLGDVRDVLGLQNQIASAIAKQIRMTLIPREEIRAGIPRPANPASYETYLRGEYFLNRFTPDSIRKAADYFQQVIEDDPSYVPAYVKLAGAYQMLGNMNVVPKKVAYAKANTLVVKALELDPEFAAAHAVRGWRLLLYELDFVAAAPEFKRAVALNPNGVEGHEGMATYYETIGQIHDAVQEMERARELDPLALIVNNDLCTALFYARRYDEALSQCKANIDLDPNAPRSFWIVGDVYAAKGMESEAVVSSLQALQLAGAPPSMIAAARIGARDSGLKGFWKALAQFVPENVKNGNLDAYDAAVNYTYAGDADKALFWLGKAVEARCFGITYLGVNPLFDQLRSDGRFVSLLNRIGLHRADTRKR